VLGKLEVLRSRIRAAARDHLAVAHVLAVQLGIALEDHVRFPEGDRPALIQKQHPVGKLPHGVQPMAHVDDRVPALDQPLEGGQALLLEDLVPDGQDLVEEQHLRAYLKRRRERQANLHPG
jgi:hypothetical protein